MINSYNHVTAAPQPAVTLPKATTAAHPIGTHELTHKYPHPRPALLSFLLHSMATVDYHGIQQQQPLPQPKPLSPTAYHEQQRAYVNALVGKLLLSQPWLHNQFLTPGLDVTVQAIASIWPNATNAPSNGNRPIVNLSTFLHHILKHSRTTHSTLQLAIFYLFRIRPRVLERKHDDVYISCGRRMFLAALICAHKFLQDKTYKNSAWSKVSGLSVAEVNHAEKVMLQLLDWSLFVKKDTYDQWILMLQSHLKYRLPTVSVAPTTTTTAAAACPEDPVQVQWQRKVVTRVDLGMPTPVEELGHIKQSSLPCVAVDVANNSGLLSPPNERKRRASHDDNDSVPAAVKRRLGNE